MVQVTVKEKRNGSIQVDRCAYLPDCPVCCREFSMFGQKIAKKYFKENLLKNA